MEMYIDAAIKYEAYRFFAALVDIHFSAITQILVIYVCIPQHLYFIAYIP